jgi:hypothetical protein
MFNTMFITKYILIKRAQKYFGKGRESNKKEIKLHVCFFSKGNFRARFCKGRLSENACKVSSERNNMGGFRIVLRALKQNRWIQ